MILNVNQSLHGFEILRKRELADISATLFEMEHKKSGAELIFLEREDMNKTFAIGFTTTPDDDTGVFHILEHSVLCGSDKYPVKEPFVELLKSSLNTFLNAMTYNDKTVYPVCSKNEKDFQNLISVYMDAVLHPAAVSDERIFRQEGWHYEVNASGELTYNGVVYNEMKGAYSQVDNLSGELLMTMLYEGTPYAKDSGGNPDFIPSLTYESFVEAHKRYYHPSNAKIVLDGSMDIDSVLALLDSYLSEYDRREVNIEIAAPKTEAPSFMQAEYEIAEGEDKTSKSRVLIGYLTADCDDAEGNLAITLINDYLAGSNEAPLKKALLDSGLCEDVLAYEQTGIIKNSFVIEVRNTKDSDTEKITSLIDEILLREIKAGFDTEMLGASLNFNEFRLREFDMGYPKGLSIALSAYDTWLYGKDPAIPLSYTRVIASLREKLGSGYLESLTEELFLKNQSKKILLMSPSHKLAEERRAALRAELDKVSQSLGDGGLEKIARECAEFKEWQGRTDSDEALSMLPTLTLDEISAEVEKIPTELLENDGARLLHHPIETGGIVYSSFVFDATDLTGEELVALSLMSNMMLNVRTENYDTLTLQQKIKASLGVFAPVCAGYVLKDGKCMPALTFKANALERNKDKIPELLKEVLYTSDFSDRQTLKKIISQIKIASEEAFIAGGHVSAMMRAGSHVSHVCAVCEYFDGYESYCFIKKYESNFDAECDALISRMYAVAKKLFVKERLTVNISCERDGSYLSSLISGIKHGERAEDSKIKLFGKVNEALIIPSPVAYAAIASDLYKIGTEYTGAMQVARMILNYEHLWSAVRVKGGAYGAGILMRSSGRCAFYSYRDPSPDASLSAYKSSGGFLRSYVKENPDLTKLIIGAVGASTPLLTPRSATENALVNYLGGISYEDECRMLEEILSTTAAAIEKIADTVDAVSEQGTVCIIGGDELVKSCQGVVDSVLHL